MTEDIYAKARRVVEAAKKATPQPWESVSVKPAGIRTDETGEVVASWGESPGRLINGPPQTLEPGTLSLRWFTRKEDGDYIALVCNEAPALARHILAAPETDGLVEKEIAAINAQAIIKRSDTWQARAEKAETEATTLRQRIAEVEGENERLSDKCAHLEIDLSNVVPRANEAERERDEALRREKVLRELLAEAPKRVSDAFDNQYHRHEHNQVAAQPFADRITDWLSRIEGALSWEKRG